MTGVFMLVLFVVSVGFLTVRQIQIRTRSATDVEFTARTAMESSITSMALGELAGVVSRMKGTKIVETRSDYLLFKAMPTPGTIDRNGGLFVKAILRPGKALTLEAMPITSMGQASTHAALIAVERDLRGAVR